VRDHVGALIRKVPLQSEVALMSRSRIRGNDGDEERAVMEFVPDLLIPRIPTAQFAFVEPDLDAGSTERSCDALSGRRIF
jgi:hypothetical protein